MNDDKQMGLERARQLLMRVFGVSMQGSYGRRAPTAEARNLCLQIRDILNRVLLDSPNDVDALRMLSQTDEVLLDYSNAIAHLQRAMTISHSPQRRDFKRLAALNVANREWELLGLTPSQLSNLGQYLHQYSADVESGGRTLTHTKRWLCDAGIADPDSIIEAMSRRGANTDFEIYHNIVRA